MRFGKSVSRAGAGSPPSARGASPSSIAAGAVLPRGPEGKAGAHGSPRRSIRSRICRQWRSARSGGSGPSHRHAQEGGPPTLAAPDLCGAVEAGALLQHGVCRGVRRRRYPAGGSKAPCRLSKGAHRVGDSNLGYLGLGASNEIQSRMVHLSRKESHPPRSRGQTEVDYSAPNRLPAPGSPVTRHRPRPEHRYCPRKRR